MLAKGYGVDIRITARTATTEAADVMLAEFRGLVYERVGKQDIYGEDEELLAPVVARLLLERKLTICPAESCTGGLLAKMLTDVPGSSDYLHEGYVTYANDAKEKLLGVQPETLERHGAVSEETVREMARGARQRSGAALGVAITGIAGPAGGSAEKPVGLTWIGLATASGEMAQAFRFLGDREQNRISAAHAALNLVRRTIMNS